MPAPVDRITYYEGLNECLLQSVPEDSLRILEVGCANGNLGARLKQQRTGRTVYGIERDPAAAAIARKQLDAVFEFDVEVEMPPLEPGSLDCIIYGDVLEHLVDPWSVLERHRNLISPSGRVLCSIPNIQHHSVLKQILRGDFQYLERGLLDETHLRFFTFATAFKMLLDAGFEPELVDTIDIGGGDALIEAASPLITEVHSDMRSARRFMNAQQMIIGGRPLTVTSSEEEQPLTIVACVNDEAQLKANLLRSPCLRSGGPHEVLLFRECRSAAEGLNEGISQAHNELVVLVHQDVYLPRGWPNRLADQWSKASKDRAVGLAGVFGSRERPPFVESRQHSDTRGHVGYIVDRDHLLTTAADDTFPCAVDYLDEVLMVVPRSTPLRIDPALGWHLYGTDLCLQAQQQGLSAFVIGALCMHNSLTGSAGADYLRSEEVMVSKWGDCLPIHTVNSTIYGPRERHRMERVEAEREEALTELERTRAALALIETSRTWRARNRIRGVINRLPVSERAPR
jgi:SAM-dependent methyltransferase